jgi:CTP synthase
MKYVIVTGGVISGLGKGIIVSSIGFLMKARGHKVTAIKIDPYLNWDAGTINPYEHGEVFILEDGREVDLDLGNYERFLDVDLSGGHNLTTGKVYERVIKKERRGDYLGKTVQIIPHVTNEIKKWIRKVARSSKAEICLVEVGGTVGDIESMPFLEALRQMKLEEKNNLTFVHVTLVPTTGPVGEQKTKPTQHSVKEIREIGIAPDFIIGRGNEPMQPSTKQKISLFCNVTPESVISAPDVESIYSMPLVLEKQKLPKLIAARIDLESGTPALSKWKKFVNSLLNPVNTVNIGVVGKYTSLKDAYLSIKEAFNHAGAELSAKVELKWIEADELLQNLSLLNNLDGLLVPGGFGPRGTEGKILAISHARKNFLPFLGICFGFQLAVVEYARNVLELERASSTEIDPDTPNPIICIMPEQCKVKNLGGSMRRGGQPVKIRKETLAYSLYNKDETVERHRHRYEVNPSYWEMLEKGGMVISGYSGYGKRQRTEIVELPPEKHPFFIASQFHPELKSRPTKPSPLFYGLVETALHKKLELVEQIKH